MTDKKPTDKEIKKALECCKNEGVVCFECPYKKANGCMEKLSADALDLINRLEVDKETYKDCFEKCFKDLENAHTEAIKEFARELMLIPRNTVRKDEIKNLLKEKVGDE